MSYLKAKAVKERFRGAGKQIANSGIMAIEKLVAGKVEEVFTKTSAAKRITDEVVNAAMLNDKK